jgi:GT2 family glycosyltransferase
LLYKINTSKIMNFTGKIIDFKLSVVFASRGGNTHHLINILWCLNKQSFQDFNVYAILDYPVYQKEYESVISTIIAKVSVSSEVISEWNGKRDKKYNIICNYNSKFSSLAWDSASYIRNYWLDLAAWEFINFFDDDIIFNDTYLQDSLNYRESFRKQIWKDFVLTPTLMYRQTGQIQNQWFKRYVFRQSRPQVNFLKNKKHDFIQLYSWNSLLATSSLFKQFRFDEDINFVGEDLDFTYTIHKAWYPILVLADLKVYHMERDKSLLDHAWVGNPVSAYQKWKNRIIFVRKHGNFLQKFIFYTFSLWANNVWLIIKILRYAKRNQKRKLISSFLRWNRDWLFNYKKH